MSVLRKRVAIIGAGIGREHFSAYQNLSDRFEVAVVCDRDEARALEVVAGSGIATSASVDEVLGDPSVDIVDVCLPPFLHLPTSARASRAGKHGGARVQRRLKTSCFPAGALVFPWRATGQLTSPWTAQISCWMFNRF